MDESIKIIISGLDNAGKTSILTALDKKYDFRKDVLELKPTYKVEYHTTDFLDRKVYFWDMGGQLKFRKQYQNRADMYFADTDLLVYIMDIKDEDSIEDSLDYLNSILDYFDETNQDVPLIVSFHKYDPELRAKEEVNDRIDEIRETIMSNYPSLKILFQHTSIYDIISIVQLISYGLSIFDEKFFELSERLEAFLLETDCLSLILFDRNGIIISEFYNDTIETDYYVHLLESIKEHLYLVKRMQEEDYDEEHDFIEVERGLISYFHSIEIEDDMFYISALIKEDKKENLMDNLDGLLNALRTTLESLVS